MSARQFHGWPSRMPAGRIAYVNGRYLPLAQAGVHIEDRALQFADGIYEVVGVLGGLVLDEEHHLDRLERSVGEIGMAMPMEREPLKFVIREMARRNRVVDGLIYMQVTRGVYRRDHAIPLTPSRPTLIMTARPMNPLANDKRREQGVAVITQPDQRWARCDIKSTALLPNILAKTEARNAGAFEAWLIDRDGFITEGSSTSAWIVDEDGNIVTRDLSNAILPGVTRREIMDAAAEAQITIVERKFTPDEALAAREAFMSAATLGATAIVSIDGKPVGDGRPGPVTRRLQELYLRRAEKLASAT
ncbi:MAG TPA: D-amino-acid transaminase [Rhizomicrobium sp.]|nr:D-amino-acid transaminase [Rhizomicrobium sp.]